MGGNKMNTWQYQIQNKSNEANIIKASMLFFFVFAGVVFGCTQYCGGPTGSRTVSEACTVDSECNCTGVRLVEINYSCTGHCPNWWLSCISDDKSVSVRMPITIEEACTGNVMDLLGLCNVGECRTASTAETAYGYFHSGCICVYWWL